MNAVAPGLIRPDDRGHERGVSAATEATIPMRRAGERARSPAWSPSGIGSGQLCHRNQTEVSGGRGM